LNTKKRALITGTSRGIGNAIAEQMLRQGWSIVGTSRSGGVPSNLSTEQNFTGVPVNFSQPSDLADKLKPIIYPHPPDVLINNVGTFQEADFQLSDADWLEIWQHTMQVNLTSAALLCKWFINSHLDHQSEGIIINIASRAAYRGDMSEFTAYAASKGGMVAMTKSIARGFGRQGIVAYSIAPGFVETDMAQDSIETYGKEYLTRDSSFDQMTQPSEVANLVAYLATGQVKHMTGSSFHINGGSYMI